MNALEYLRYIARMEGDNPIALANEVSYIFADMASDRELLVSAVRRLLDHHGDLGVMWMVAARVLGSLFPEEEAWYLVGELSGSEDANFQALMDRDWMIFRRDGSIDLTGTDQVHDLLRNLGDVDDLLQIEPNVGIALESDLVGSGFALVSASAQRVLSNFYQGVEREKLIIANSFSLVPASIRSSLAERVSTDVFVSKGILLTDLDSNCKVLYRGSKFPPSLIESLVKWRVPQEILRSAGPLLG